MIPAPWSCVQLGPLPPPWGGIATHVERLTALLNGDGVPTRALNHFPRSDGAFCAGSLYRNPVRYFAAVVREPATTVHYHHSRLDTLLAVAAAPRSRGHKRVVTLHGDSVIRQLTTGPRVVRAAAAAALRRFDQLIGVNEKIADAIAGLGRPVSVVPAYLPPPSGATLRERPDGPLMIAAAYRVAEDERSDLWGLDRALAIFGAAQRRVETLRLELYVGQEPTDARARKYLQDQLDRLPGAAREHLDLRYGETLVDRLHPAAVFLRPSRADGDAVSVREALDVGCSVLCSEIVARPEGATVLSLADTEAWAKRAADEALSGSERTRPERPDPALHPYYRAVRAVLEP